MTFFHHYRSVEARAKYSVLSTDAFGEEFTEFENYIKDYWSPKTCAQFYVGARTNSVESFFATRLFHVPKHIYFPKMYMVKMFCCSMQWNEKHVSEIFTAFHGASGVQKRKNWFWNVHIRAFEKTQALKYVGRISTNKKRRLL